MGQGATVGGTRRGERCHNARGVPKAVATQARDPVMSTGPKKDTEKLPIIVTVERVRCGHESVLSHARVISGDPYVLAHHTASNFAELCGGLAETGHPFGVCIEDRHVSILEFVNFRSARDQNQTRT